MGDDESVKRRWKQWEHIYLADDGNTEENKNFGNTGNIIHIFIGCLKEIAIRNKTTHWKMFLFFGPFLYIYLVFNKEFYLYII